MGIVATKLVQLAGGAIAGGVATAAMKGVMSLLESKKKMSIKQAFRDRKPAEREVIDRLNKRYGWKMSRPRRATAAKGLRWAVGAGSGALGSYLTRRLGKKGHPLQAAALSVLTFMIVDEVIKPAIGVRPDPREVPLQTHAAALAGHATYGLVNAGAEQMMQKVMPRR